MISNNPTKTRGIEKAWRREINRRWARFKRETVAELRRLNRITVNVFNPDPSQLRAYIIFFNQKIDELLVGNWQEQYQRRSYELAIERANAALRSQGARLTFTSADFETAAGITSFTATQTLGLTAEGFANASIHVETLEFLFGRSFESLEGFTATMAREVRTILFNGVQSGAGVEQLVRDITARIDVSRSRARLVAQTETIQAYQRGTINQVKLAEEFLDEEISLRWITVRDAKVRHLHARWHGSIKTPDETFKRINVSPWNCRCGQLPVISEADTEVKQKKFNRERKELEALTA